MKLLSVGLVNHDTNFTYYDGERLYYHKLERTKGEKRFVLYPIHTWKEEISKLWNIQVEDMDDIIFQFDPTVMIPPALTSFLKTDFLDRNTCYPLSPQIANHLGVNKGWFMGHHSSHTYSTWMLEDRTPDVHIVIDGLGDGRPWSVYINNQTVGRGNIMKGSIGWHMRDVGKILGISHVHQNDIAGKLMGLQAYGTVDYGFYTKLSRLSIEDANELFDYNKWVDHKGNEILAKHTKLDWIRTIHYTLEYLMVKFFQQYARPTDTISYTGGVAQNVIWNSRLKREFPNLIIPPHASDEGTSLGGIEWLRQFHGLPEIDIPDFPFMQTDQGTAKITDHTIQRTADLLTAGKVVGWYHGQGEIGPRALGHRSILMDPRLRDGRKRINEVKQREAYRPFGASVIAREYSKYFEGPADPFMLYTSQVKNQPFLQAITHLDGSSRVQLVNSDVQPLYELLEAFHTRTGCPILLNTSLNLAGKPIAGLPQDALKLFYSSNIDAMVIGDKIYEKN